MARPVGLMLPTSILMEKTPRPAVRGFSAPRQGVFHPGSPSPARSRGSPNAPHRPPTHGAAHTSGQNRVPQALGRTPRGRNRCRVPVCHPSGTPRPASAVASTPYAGSRWGERDSLPNHHAIRLLQIGPTLHLIGSTVGWMHGHPPRFVRRASPNSQRPTYSQAHTSKTHEGVFKRLAASAREAEGEHVGDVAEDRLQRQPDVSPVPRNDREGRQRDPFVDHLDHRLITDRSAETAAEIRR